MDFYVTTPLKEVVIVAGANGSGKTTCAKPFVRHRAYGFVNAEEIGATLDGQEGFQLTAGRLFFEKVNELSEAGRSFVLDKAAQDENHRLGLPNVFSRNGKIYYELPNGDITTESPLKD